MEGKKLKITQNLLVIGGPTGGGKDTVVAELIKRYEHFDRLITATTRSPRAYEQHTLDYYFFSKEQFEQALVEGDILEHTYFSNRDEYYGTYRPDLEKRISSGKIPIAVTDRVGARFMKDRYGATTLMIVPTPFHTLHERFRSREPDATEEWILKRIDNARVEIELGSGHFDYVIENEYGKLDQTISAVEIILRKHGYLSFGN